MQEQIASVHDLLARYGPEAVEQWFSGGAPPVDSLGVLTPADAAALQTLWAFWARPGQRWIPGEETITYYSAGRGFGKSLVLSHAIREASKDPRRWAYEAMIIGITPGDARALLEQETGIIRVAQECGDPAPSITWVNQRGVLIFPPPPGEQRGLRVRVASSANPNTARGPNIGLLLADEWAFFSDTRDEQGMTCWEAAMSALRVGDAKALVVSSPSRKRAVREMRRDAEEPLCSDRVIDGRKIAGCNDRLPRMQGRPISPLFSATTTTPRRVCPTCNEPLIATVRLVSGSTLDNEANLHASYVARARLALAAGSKRSRGEFGGEIVDDDNDTAIPSIKVHDLAGFTWTSDPWDSLKRELGIVKVIVVVDPATTGGEGSADTGLLVVGITRRVGGVARVYGLQDWSLSAADVEGSPSRTWAPRAALMAALWRADEIKVECNNGGLEVLHPPRLALERLSYDMIASCLSEQVEDAMSDALVSEMLTRSRSCSVVQITRRADKATRWDWASGPASTGELCCVRAPWLPADHWRTAVEHLTRPVEARGLIDRGDTLISGAQELFGVRERAGAVGLVDPASSPVYSGFGL